MKGNYAEKDCRAQALWPKDSILGQSIDCKNQKGFIRQLPQSMRVTYQEAKLRSSSRALPMAVDLEAVERCWPWRGAIHLLPPFLR